MAETDNIVNVTITAETRTPSRTGFGTPCIFSYHTVFPERARIYSNTSDMITDGFAVTDKAYLAATALSAQNPRPPQWVVGRTDNDEKMKIDITPTATLFASYAYKVFHNGVEAKYTTDATPTVAEITAGLTSAIDPTAWAITTAYTVGEHVTNDTGPVKIYICTTAGTSAGAGGPTGTGSGIVDGTAVWSYVGAKSAITATDGTTKVTVEADTVADAFTMYVDNIDLLDIVDVTPDGSPGIVDDITAIRVENDDWYAAIITNQGSAVIQAAAAHIETLNKIYFASTLDTGTYDATSTTDVAYILAAANYDRTILMYHDRANQQYPEAAWAGKGLPNDPGSLTWAFKTLSGITVMSLNETRVTALRGKDTNFYAARGVTFTQDGKVVSGEWIDVIRTIDWTEARIQEGIIRALSNSKKIPFTDKGATQIQNEVEAVLREGVNNDAFSNDPAPNVIVPKVADVSTANKALRLLPDVEFTATLAGAIHKTVIEGTISV